MSVTISIANNLEYCRIHGKITFRPSYCQCCWPDGQNPETDCPGCHGTGKDGMDFPEMPAEWEMNLANGNFATFWSSLGLDVKWYGTIRPQRLLRILQSWDAELCVRGSDSGVGQKGAKWFSCGLSLEQVREYQERLIIICQEAIKREEHVSWS